MELAFVRPSVRFLFCIMNHPPHPIVYPEINAITNNIELHFGMECTPSTMEK